MPKFNALAQYYGSKWGIADWIAGLFPRHKTYVEPMGGMANVLLAKEPAWKEVYNDVNDRVFNVFRVLRDDKLSPQLIDAIWATPYSREEFIRSFEASEDPVEDARRFIVRSKMGWGSASLWEETNSYRSTGKSHARAWARLPASLVWIVDRLRQVNIEHRDYREIVEMFDRYHGTLFYFDPPYLPETRSRQIGSAYPNDMTRDDHTEFLEIINNMDSMVAVSGYRSDLYDDALTDWTRYDKLAHGNGNGRTKGVKFIESVWVNERLFSAWN